METTPPQLNKDRETGEAENVSDVPPPDNEGVSKYRALFESTPSPTILLDRRNRIDNINRAAVDLFGTLEIPGRENRLSGPRGSFIGVELREIIPLLGDALENLDKSEEQTRRLEIQVPSAETDRRLRVWLSRLDYDNKRSWGGTAVLLEDVTGRLQAEDELRKRKGLEEILEKAGAVSHKLNQPLQAVYGYSQLLMMEIKKEDPIYNKLERIVEQVDKMGNLTKSLGLLIKNEEDPFI